MAFTSWTSYHASSLRNVLWNFARGGVSSISPGCPGSPRSEGSEEPDGRKSDGEVSPKGSDTEGSQRRTRGASANSDDVTQQPAVSNTQQQSNKRTIRESDEMLSLIQSCFEGDYVSQAISVAIAMSRIYRSMYQDNISLSKPDQWFEQDKYRELQFVTSVDNTPATTKKFDLKDPLPLFFSDCTDGSFAMKKRGAHEGKLRNLLFKRFCELEEETGNSKEPNTQKRFNQMLVFYRDVLAACMDGNPSAFDVAEFHTRLRELDLKRDDPLDRLGLAWRDLCQKDEDETMEDEAMEDEAMEDEAIEAEVDITDEDRRNIAVVLEEYLEDEILF
ncbi:MAG: hypothetical protein SGILL_004781 [Bacillariaceae sp.]